MVNHKVLLLDTGYSLYRLMQQNPTLREEFELLGLDFSDEVRVSDRSRLIEQISASVRSCQLVLLVDHAPQLRAREILAQGFNKPLHQNERAAADIRKYLGNQGRMPNDRLLQGAMMPQDALPLSDPGCGQAGGGGGLHRAYPPLAAEFSAYPGRHAGPSGAAADCIA